MEILAPIAGIALMLVLMLVGLTRVAEALGAFVMWVLELILPPGGMWGLEQEPEESGNSPPFLAAIGVLAVIALAWLVSHWVAGAPLPI